eukprot:NODE_148_length_17471_cov_0.413136.p8 type:complete len:189 gc:universal NODE_148_length_17471_cov_0.413136:3733-4299(+)
MIPLKAVFRTIGIAALLLIHIFMVCAQHSYSQEFIPFRFNRTFVIPKFVKNNLIFMSTKDLNVYSSVEHKSLKSLDQYPDLELTRFDDAYCYRLVDDHYPQYGFVKNVTIGVMKSDFCRYLLVYHFGGVYIDSDVVLKTHPRDWILPLTHIKNNTNNVINFVAGIEGIPLDKYKAVGFCGPIQIVQVF